MKDVKLSHDVLQSLHFFFVKEEQIENNKPISSKENCWLLEMKTKDWKTCKLIFNKYVVLGRMCVFLINCHLAV